MAAVQAVREKFLVFAATCLVIRDKAGKARKLVLNRAQQYAHDKIEEQKAATGKVRALVLKGRQQGISTYIAARFYWLTSLFKGIRTFVMAHEQKASDNLFGMAKRYNENNPFAPTTSADSAKELTFGGLDSGYKVATAGSKDTGRSFTAQLLHGSEFAFWKNASTHLAGIGNAVADEDGTEIILESTGNGIGTPFHELWQKAEAGDCEYIAIFIPWFWQPEYKSDIPEKGLELTKEDLEYQQAFSLTDRQMAWRRNKISTYGTGHEWLFDQEYPATPAMAFKSPTANPLISPLLVSKAQNSKYSQRYGPLIIGCDPAEYGDDRTAIVFRQGRVVFRIETYEKKGPMEVAGMIAAYYREFDPDAILIDRIGIGSGIVDRLREQNIPVIGVNSAETPEDSLTYANRRAEMWWRMQEWFEDSPVRIPKDMALASDLSAPGFKHNSNGLKLLESKDSMRSRGIRSPDIGDALALTFAVNVASRSHDDSHAGRSSNAGLPASNAGY